MQTDKKASPVKSRRLFFSGVLLLGASNIIVKLIGLCFKIPMSYYLGSEGMGYFNSAYQIYTWLYMLSTAGLPVAVSILVSEGRARGDRLAVRRVDRISSFLFLVLGIIGTAIMLLGARPLAHLIGAPDSRYAILALAPTLFLICLSSASRGYFQGFQQMAPPAVSGVLEAFGKLIVGVLLVTYAVGRGYSLPIVAAFAVFGLFVGEAFSFLYLLLSRFYYARRGRFTYLRGADSAPALSASAAGPTAAPGAAPSMPQTVGGRSLLSRLVRIALPITASASVMSIVGLLDLVLVQRRLRLIGYTAAEATAFYGNYTTLAVPMFNLPPALIYPLATAALPLLAATVAGGNRERAGKLTGSLLRITSLIAMPASLGMSVFSRPILRLFFPEEMADSAAPYLSVLAMAILFLSLLSVSNAVLQANGKASRPMISMLAGGAVKLVAGYLLMGNPRVGGFGVPLGTLLCYLVAVGFNFFFLVRESGAALSLGGVFFRPFAASFLAVGGALGAYLLLGGEGGGAMALFLAMVLAVLLYVAAAFLTRAVTREDLVLLPLPHARRRPGGAHPAHSS